MSYDRMDHALPCNAYLARACGTAGQVLVISHREREKGGSGVATSEIREKPSPKERDCFRDARILPEKKSLAKGLN